MNQNYIGLYKPPLFDKRYISTIYKIESTDKHSVVYLPLVESFCNDLINEVKMSSYDNYYIIINETSFLYLGDIYKVYLYIKDTMKMNCKIISFKLLDIDRINFQEDTIIADDNNMIILDIPLGSDSVETITIEFPNIAPDVTDPEVPDPDPEITDPEVPGPDPDITDPDPDITDPEVPDPDPEITDPEVPDPDPEVPIEYKYHSPEEEIEEIVYDGTSSLDILLYTPNKSILFLNYVSEFTINHYNQLDVIINEIHVPYNGNIYNGLSYNDILKISPSWINKLYCNEFGSFDEIRYATDRNIKIGGKWHDII